MTVVGSPAGHRVGRDAHSGGKEIFLLNQIIFIAFFSLNNKKTYITFPTHKPTQQQYKKKWSTNTITAHSAGR